MDAGTLALLLLLLFAGALLYSSVGHAGASAYLAAMALLSVAPETLKPTALALNVCVASFAVFRYARAGLIDLRVAALCIVGSAPMAWLGGGLALPAEWFRLALGLMLLLAALRLWLPEPVAAGPVAPPSAWKLPLAGAGIGLAAGLTGTGGGIFLSPLLVFMRWVEIRRSLGTASLFILCNSAAGLAGNFASLRKLPPELPWMIGAVMLGAVLGTWLGIARYRQPGLRRALGLVVAIAGAKLALS
ncbi:MAG TPA: sulfite exporter TauE/SafE family protein [Solimonas sp.]|nr:sulfite exporter TauE/SafE family protein [Solimonas sp.]